MAMINEQKDFETLIDNISFFSHAYILNTNSLKETMILAKYLAKKIILENVSNQKDIEDITYKIDNDIFDDLYIVDPPTSSIKNEEIEKLLQYMQTKSIRLDGRRVYIINGFERISNDMSNKILKFLEEPEENIYGILISCNLEQVLSTIKSRAQIINVKLKINEDNPDDIIRANNLINLIISKKEKSIPYTSEIIGDIISDRDNLFQMFNIMEKIFSNSIGLKNGLVNNEFFYNEKISELSIMNLIKMLEIINNLKQLIKNNINLNLLIDRLIISLVKEMNYGESCRNSI